MGILSRLREKKAKPVIERKRIERAMKDVDVAKSLAMYIISAEILMAEFIDGKHPFIHVYDKFRQEWRLEDMINSFSSYDGLFRAVYKEVMEWMEKHA